MTSPIAHLSPSEIIALHDRAIALFGGLPGVPEPGKVDALIGRVLHREAARKLATSVARGIAAETM